jgi:hypothetical protein
LRYAYILDAEPDISSSADIDVLFGLLAQWGSALLQKVTARGLGKQVSAF